MMRAALAGIRVVDLTVGAAGPELCRVLAEFGAETYAPVTLRVAQTFFLEGRPWRWEKMKKVLLDTLPAALEAVTPVPGSPSSAPH